MEQRTYQGDVSPNGLADFLVQHYGNQDRLQAQKLGQGDALAVQIGEEHHHHEGNLRHALTLGIHRATGDEPGIVVTMGQQQWITPQMAAYAAMMGLISVLVTPWALFALLWPVSHLLGSRALPGDVWNSVETYVLSQGGSLAQTQELAHPHLG